MGIFECDTFVLIEHENRFKNFEKKVNCDNNNNVIVNVY